jgi:hypothetical protein
MINNSCSSFETGEAQIRGMRQTKKKSITLSIKAITDIVPLSAIAIGLTCFQKAIYLQWYGGARSTST